MIIKSLRTIFKFSDQLSKQQRLIYSKLEIISKQYQELSDLAIKGECNNLQRKNMNSLEPQVSLFLKYKTSLSILEDLQNSMNSSDIEEKEFSKEEFDLEQQRIDKLRDEALSALIAVEEYDDCTSTMVEIRPGVGGGESSLFADDILNMVIGYSAEMGWNCKTISYQKDTSINKGCKYGVLQIDGMNSYLRMKCESGVHKVIRVPETESKGRLHSSTVTLAVLPNIVEEFVLDEKDLRLDYMRASGAGGQHVNKTDSACRVTHIPTGIQVVNMDERSQDKNKNRAMKVMRERLFKMHVQNQQEKLATRRKQQIGSSDRSDKIRTYNFPQDRITDHRTNITLFSMEKMMGGQLLDQFIDAFLEKIYNAKLEDLLEELEE